MKRTIIRWMGMLTVGLATLCNTVLSTEVYVDARKGCDCNAGTTDAPVKTITKAYALLREADGNQDADGTIYVQPGIYLVEEAIFLKPPRKASGATLTIQAVKLPGEEDWKPEDMPVILPGSWMGELGIEGFETFTSVFVVQRNHVAIRGLKFSGYPNPTSRYIPVLRLQSELDHLEVEQCLFAASKDTPIQVGVLADGEGIQVNHCVFYNAKNSVVFWRKSGEEAKKGNQLTYSIVYGAYQSGVWTALEDDGLVFKNNIVTKCKHGWVSNVGNATVYTAENCVIVDNEYDLARCGDDGVFPGVFELESINVRREGTLEFVTAGNVDEPIPPRYLHLVPGSLGSELGAGLFPNE